MIGDYLHLFHGVTEGFRRKKVNGNYTILSMIDKTSTNYEGHFLGRGRLFERPGAVIKGLGSYESSNKLLIFGFIRNETKMHIPLVIVGLLSQFCVFELFQFGGMDFVSRSTDSFHIGTLKNGDPAAPLRWTVAPQYKLKQTVYGFGHIQYKQFIVIFGGSGSDDLQCLNWQWPRFDDIYILDLSKQCGWVWSPIKCPSKMKCSAVLDANLMVHLQSHDELNGHWMRDLHDIIPGLTPR